MHFRGNYAPIPSQYSKDMHDLVANIFEENPKTRPSIKDILNTDLIRPLAKRSNPAKEEPKGVEISKGKLKQITTFSKWILTYASD